MTEAMTVDSASANPRANTPPEQMSRLSTRASTAPTASSLLSSPRSSLSTPASLRRGLQTQTRPHMRSPTAQHHQHPHSPTREYWQSHSRRQLHPNSGFKHKQQASDKLYPLPRRQLLHDYAAKRRRQQQDSSALTHSLQGQDANTATQRLRQQGPNTATRRVWQQQLAPRRQRGAWLSMREQRTGSSGGFHPFNGRVSNALEGSARAVGSSLRAPGDTAWLSYHDVLLTKEDIDTLRSSDWLTDNVISFWQEYLERECLANEKKANIVLLRPSMAFLLMQTKDSDVMALKSALPALENITHVFCPVNDCRNPAQAEGGSHWSLLLVSVLDRMAFHYDSLSSANESEAMLLTQRLERLLGFRLEFRDLDDSPQQENGSDCGVFVCAAIEHLLLEKLLRQFRGQKINMSLGNVHIDAPATRKRIAKTIESFRKEGERRRSRSASPFPMKRHRLSSTSSRSPPRIGDE